MDIRHVSFIDRVAVTCAWWRCADLVDCVLRMLVDWCGSFILGRTQPDLRAVASAAFVLSRGDGHQFFRDGLRGAAVGHYQGGLAAAPMGSGFGQRDPGSGLGIVVATLGRGSGNGGLSVFLLLSDCGTGTLLHSRYSAVPQVHGGLVHVVWTGVHELHSAAGRRTSPLDDVSNSTAWPVAPRLDAQAGERGKQLCGRLSQRACGSIRLSADVRLAASPKTVLVGFVAMPNIVVFHHVSAFPLFRRRFGGRSGSPSRLVDGKDIRRFMYQHADVRDRGL